MKRNIPMVFAVLGAMWSMALAQDTVFTIHLLPKYVGGPISATSLEQPIAVYFTVTGLKANFDYDQAHMGFLTKGTTSVRGSKWTVNGWISPSTQLPYKQSDADGSITGWAFLRTPSSYIVGVDTTQVRIRLREHNQTANVQYDSDPLTSLNINDTATGPTAGALVYGYLDSTQYGGMIVVAFADTGTRPLSSWFVLPPSSEWTTDFFTTRMDTTLRRGGYFQLVVPVGQKIGRIEVRDTMNVLKKSWSSTQWTAGAAGSKTEINFSLSPVVDRIGSSVPENFVLEQNYPNPFNPETSIRFGIPVRTSVRLAVFNTLGEQIATLVNGAVEAGVHEVTWNGRNDAGATVASGMYFYRMETPGSVQTQKMMLVK